MDTIINNTSSSAATATAIVNVNVIDYNNATNIINNNINNTNSNNNNNNDTVVCGSLKSIAEIGAAVRQLLAATSTSSSTSSYAYASLQQHNRSISAPLQCSNQRPPVHPAVGVVVTNKRNNKRLSISTNVNDDVQQSNDVMEVSSCSSLQQQKQQKCQQQVVQQPIITITVMPMKLSERMLLLPKRFQWSVSHIQRSLQRGGPIISSFNYATPRRYYRYDSCIINRTLLSQRLQSWKHDAVITSMNNTTTATSTTASTVSSLSSDPSLIGVTTATCMDVTRIISRISGISHDCLKRRINIHTITSTSSTTSVTSSHATNGNKGGNGNGHYRSSSRGNLPSTNNIITTTTLPSSHTSGGDNNGISVDKQHNNNNGKSVGAARLARHLQQCGYGRHNNNNNMNIVRVHH
jgi:hypothetical protein